MKKIWVFSFFLLFLSCSKNPGFLYEQKRPQRVIQYKTHLIKNIENSGAVDILWVIDNSISMTPFQKNVIDNAERFMSHFTKYNLVKWRMGLISTDVSEVPYLGFGQGRNFFDHTHPDPIKEFQNAVSKLGIYGSIVEKSFLPVLNTLDDFPHFIRPRSIFIVIFVSDEEEHSYNISSEEFLDEIMLLKDNQNHLVTMYGAMGFKDLGCLKGQDPFYAGTRYEYVISKTGGFSIPICAGDFGAQLASIGKDIVRQLTDPFVTLKFRPVSETIKILYEGKEIEGGVTWFYDIDNNIIAFKSLDFANAEDTASVEIYYEVDNGYDYDD